MDNEQSSGMPANSTIALNKSGVNKQQYGGQHYKGDAIEPWDYVVANNLGFFEGTIIKYITRWRKKGGMLDLKKAEHYLAKLIEVETKRNANAKGLGER